MLIDLRLSTPICLSTPIYAPIYANLRPPICAFLRPRLGLLAVLLMASRFTAAPFRMPHYAARLHGFTIQEVLYPTGMLAPSAASATLLILSNIRATIALRVHKPWADAVWPNKVNAITAV